MHLPDEVSSDEVLYRVIKRSTPGFVSASGRVSSALFKDPSGVSVDRDGKREEAEIFRFMVSRFNGRAKMIGKLTAADCFSVEAIIRPDPSDSNPYHANIILDEGNDEISNLQARRLADVFQIVFDNENVAWKDS